MQWSISSRRNIDAAARPSSAGWPWHPRRRWMGLVALLIGVGAGAQTSGAPITPLPTIAIYSQLAREVSVTQFQESTGSRLDNNKRQRIPVPDGAFDKAVVVLAGQALRRAMPMVNPWLVAPTDEDLFDSLQTTSDGAQVNIPEDMMAALRERGAAQLILFTRYRAQASLRALFSREGTGQLEGLGYFVDMHTPTKNVDTNQVGMGYLAPYVHYRGTLIDVATRRVLRTRTTTEGFILSAADSKGSAHPWDVMTASEKMNTLRDMLTKEIGLTVPALLAKP